MVGIEPSGGDFPRRPYKSKFVSKLKIGRDEVEEEGREQDPRVAKFPRIANNEPVANTTELWSIGFRNRK